MPQAWSEITSGVYGNPELSQKARLINAKMTRLNEAVDPATEFNLGKKSGDQVGFRLVGRITTLADAALQENQRVPFGKPTLYEGTARVYRRAYAIAWTGAREDLDRLDTEDTNLRVLREQAARTLNKVIYDKLQAGRSFTYAALTSSTYSFLTDGTVSGTAAAKFSLFHIRKLILKATQYNIPPADGNGYLFFGTPIIEDDLLNDTTANSGFVDIAKYAPGRAEGILNGEIGKVGRLRIIIDNDTSTFVEGIGTGSAYGSGFMLGQEAIKEVLVYPMHFRAEMNLGGDFGNQKAICWQSLMGHSIPWNYTSNGQGSIVHYTSA